MVNISSDWQDSLNPKLVNRLTRPLHQPGMFKMAMSQWIINRCDRFLNRLPLLNQQMQRWGNNITFSSNDVPIVYAQPVSLAREPGREGIDQNFQSTVAQNKPSVPIIQRKVDSSQALPVQIQNAESSPPSPPNLGGRFQRPPELKSDSAELQAKFSDSQTASAHSSQLNPNSPSRSHPDEVTIINQTATYDSEMPLVSPQTISEELEPTEKMPLQDKLSDSQTTPANPSELNPDSPSRSHPDEGSTIDQNSISSSEMPLVSTQSLSEELEITEKMPRQAKFIDSKTASANPSPFNPNYPSQSHKDEVTPINQSFPTSSEIPVVSPQIISERLTKNEEMSLVQEFTSTSQQPLPIIQAKQQNSSRSRSSVPIVNPSSTLVNPKQTQPDNYAAEKSRSINYKNSKIKISAKKIPIVTVRPLTSQINSTKEEVKNIQNNQSNSHQNIASLPIVPVTSQVNSSLQTQSLPLSLANNTPVSNSISQKPNLSNQNAIVSNTDASSSPKIFASSSSPTQTFVSAMETQPKIDLDAITSQVQRKIMRRLVIESERRGKIR